MNDLESLDGIVCELSTIPVGSPEVVESRLRASDHVTKEDAEHELRQFEYGLCPNSENLPEAIPNNRGQNNAARN
jgi:hypothetical protein